MNITLNVYGVPAPQGNKSAFVRGGRAVVVEGRGPGRQSHAAWRQAVATAARDWQEAQGGVPLLDGPLALWVQFRMPRPPSIPKKRAWPDRKPDLDKLIRSVLDSLSGVLIVDDARIVTITAVKSYAAEEPPGCRLVVGPMDELLDLLGPVSHEPAAEVAS